VAELISVIVTTYNREDALETVLRSLARQTDADFEVVVADDGSTAATRQLIEGWKATLGRRLDHVWHADEGFRAAEIRNHAILVSRGAYCIFLDGDCIVRPDFVATHRRLAERGRFVTGNRILLSTSLTAKILRDKLTPEIWSFADWVAERLRGGVNRISALLLLPLGPLRRLRQGAWQGARSCNLAIWRSDLDRIDGDHDPVGLADRAGQVRERARGLVELDANRQAELRAGGDAAHGGWLLGRRAGRRAARHLIYLPSVACAPTNKVIGVCRRERREKVGVG